MQLEEWIMPTVSLENTIRSRGLQVTGMTRMSNAPHSLTLAAWRPEKTCLKQFSSGHNYSFLSCRYVDQMKQNH